LILIRAALAEEVASARHRRRIHHVDLHQFAQALANPLALRDLGQRVIGELDLLGEPRARIRRLLVFKPAIWIADRDPMQRVRYHLDLSFRGLAKRGDTRKGETKENSHGNFLKYPNGQDLIYQTPMKGFGFRWHSPTEQAEKDF
jgi:hypothetical protein